MKHTIHVAGTRCKLTVQTPRREYKNKAHRAPDGRWLEPHELLELRISEVEDALTKCTGKHKRHVLRGGNGRKYPYQRRAPNTAEYVKEFFELNRPAVHAPVFDYKSFYEPLSKRVQEWPQDPLHEVLDEDEGSPLIYDFAAPESLPAWLTEGVPPSWLTKG